MEILHRIRLIGQWEIEVVETDADMIPAPRIMTIPGNWNHAGWVGFAGKVRHRRRFGLPTGLDPSAVLQIVAEGVVGEAEMKLNGEALPIIREEETLTVNVTGKLKPRNILEIDLRHHCDRGGLTGEVRLEILG